MHALVPIAIILALGAVAAGILHRFSSRLWLTSLGAALLATVVWVAGTYLLIWVTAPNELGPPLLKPVLQTFATALVPALLMGLATRCRIA